MSGRKLRDVRTCHLSLAGYLAASYRIVLLSVSLFLISEFTMGRTLDATR